ncbi:flagellar hook protein FlgE [Limimaricola pyoseonensis]|uniref:Flagellar hook protein FlgE n=1 Tax=Limimaricola pyoseonensis TaxID=521013 RepID=A0A1G7EPA5_9RHOB|nr:flagellar hook protein FlgE [Limimaricola pyoseonensis]
MTISSSLGAGVAGLAANAQRLATISDNIANSATHGYRRAVTDFHSLVLEGGGGGGRYVAGGVATSTQRLIDTGGALSASSNPTDLAVRGRGFLPVAANANDAGAGDFRLVTTGSFRTDSAGYLRSPDGQVLLGWPAAADGTIGAMPRDSALALAPVRVPTGALSGQPTTEVALGVNLPATATQDGADGLPENLSVEYYDNLGAPQRLDLTFTPQLPAPGAADTNAWTLQVADAASGGAVIGEYDIAFSADRAAGGRIESVIATTGGGYDPATGRLEVAAAGGPIGLTIGRPGEIGGLSQLGDAFAPLSVERDGAPTGNLASVEVDAGGYVHAHYDNGTSRRIFQVPLVDVANPNGLMTHDGQSYSVSAESGAMLLWDAGDGPVGEVAGFAREESAVDVAEELTQLIQTQRAYSSNAKVIQTVELSLAEETDLPVEISVWVLERLELMPLRVCSATIAPLLVRMLDMLRRPSSRRLSRAGLRKIASALCAGGTAVLTPGGPGDAPPRWARYGRPGLSRP